MGLPQYQIMWLTETNRRGLRGVINGWWRGF